MTALFTLLIGKIYESTYQGSDKVIMHSCHMVCEDICHLKAFGYTLTSQAYFFYSCPALPLCCGFSPSLYSSPRFVHFCQLLLIQACPVHRLNFLLVCTCMQADLCDDRGQAVMLKVSRGEWGWGFYIFKGVVQPKWIFDPSTTYNSSLY